MTERTRQQELEDTLIGVRVKEVRYDERTGSVYMRCSSEGADEVVLSFDAASLADAQSSWHRLA